MNGERSDGGSGEPEVEDEFACAGMLRSSLVSVHGTVEQIFRVAFAIGTLELPHDGGQMWLKLRGPRGNVRAAKLFVKGVVNQEEQQQVQYPEALHCIFCGAQELFLDSLIRTTSARIVVRSPGLLQVSGLAEPVVRAYSLITDLAERYEFAQSRRSEDEDKASGESLDSRRAFKTLVEDWEDRHTSDLLVLPCSVKQILLDVVKESGLGSRPTPTSGNITRGSHDSWTELNAFDETILDVSSRLNQTMAGLGKDALVQAGSGIRGRAEGAEERLPSPKGPLYQEASFGPYEREELNGDNEQEAQSSMGNKEFWLLLKFFTAMGYTEDVVKRVLAQTGPKEASQILDLVQQEQDRSEQEDPGGQMPRNQEDIAPASTAQNRPCESEHTETGNGRERRNVLGIQTCHEVEGTTEVTDQSQEEDFVFGVMKRAAASCGYTEQNVAKVYNMLPTRSTHQLLLKLQKESSREVNVLREGPREMDDVVLEDNPAKGRASTVETKGKNECLNPPGNEKVPLAEPDLLVWSNESQRVPPKQQFPSQTVPKVKGPPMPSYSSDLDPNKQHNQDAHWLLPPTSSPIPQSHNDTTKPRSSKVQQFFPIPQLHVLKVDDSPPTKTRERRTFPAASSSVVVTGEQRFLEGLQAPFQLKLTDEPGDPKLRTIIIDASNVAMSHGLGNFFSCRGIALAVQHFWDRGHRHISALLPQWRQKIDPKTKEQHYLTELQKVGLLSFTPSREVQGKKIASHDDRFMLQLAQKTDGVIVTNDNLRDFLDESAVWRDIIKKRLLQYTFVGDLFMVPDDPLGRGGPHLDQFLRAGHRTPNPGSHSFAGSASTFPFSKPQRSHTEPCNFRDQTLGGAPEKVGGVRPGKWRGSRPGLSARDLQRLEEAEQEGGVVRSAEQTAALREQLCHVFPGHENLVTLVLQCWRRENDVNVLSDLILEQQDG